MLKKVLITFPGVPGAAAAAMLLRRHPEAELVISSSNRLPRDLEKIAELGPRDVRILGIEFRCSMQQMLDAADKALEADGAVIWLAPDRVLSDAEATQLEKLTVRTIIDRNKADIASMMLERLSEPEPEDQVLADMAADEPASEKARFLADFVRSALARYFKFQDPIAYPQAIRKIAAPQLIDKNDEADVARFRKYGNRHLVGKSEPMKTALEHIRKLGADRDIRVLIMGETGVGKEVAARLIHEYSPRRDSDFFAINCATLDPIFLESKLFGHIKGAFTGALQAKTGLFELAHGGTLFLDEVTEMPPEIQAKLLRVLQENTFTPLGSAEELHTDVRVLSATNRDIHALVRESRFREDLFYRINGCPLRLPSLRERPEDIPFIARDVHYRICDARNEPPWEFTSDELNAMIRFPWPGNVRQLENVLERAFILGRERLEQLLRDELAPARPPMNEELMRSPTEILPLKQFEAAYVQRVYEMLGRNKSRTARELGITVNTLKSKLLED